MIGANGRIDIISQVGNYILIDNSEEFESPNWRISKASDRQNEKSFNKLELFNLINLLQ